MNTKEYYIVKEDNTGRHNVYLYNQKKRVYTEARAGFLDEDDAYTIAHRLAKRDGLRVRFGNYDGDDKLIEYSYL